MAASPLLESARQLEQRGDLAPALDLYDQALEAPEHRGDPALWLHVASLCERAGLPARAAPAYAGLARAQEGLGLMAQAVASWRQALRHRPDSAEAARELARLLEHPGHRRDSAPPVRDQGHADLPQEQGRLALAIDPRDAQPPSALGAAPAPAAEPDEQTRERLAPPVGDARELSVEGVPVEPHVLEVAADDLEATRKVPVEALGAGAGYVLQVDGAPERAGAQEPTADRDLATPGAPLPQLRPMPRAALVVGQGPETGWIARSLSDLGLQVSTVERAQLVGALEVAAERACDAIFTSPELAEGWREAGPWLVAAPASLSRSQARARLALSGRHLAAARPLRDAEDLRAALGAWSGGIEVAGAFGPPMRLPPTAVPSFHLPLARRELGAELLAQPPAQERAVVVLACDERACTPLGDWRFLALEDGTIALESPAGPGEAERFAVAAALGRALELRGLAVLVLARHGEAWDFDATEPCWGPGALAVEARTGLSLAEVALDLARGMPFGDRPDRRGTAFALEMPGAPAGAGVRVEPAADGGSCFVCAHAAGRDQALRRLARALRGAGRRGPG